MNDFVLHYGSYCLAPFGLLGMWLAGRHNRWGWALSMATQTLWLAYAYITAQYGFMIGTVAYGAVYLRNFLRKPTTTGPTVEQLLYLIDQFTETGTCQLDHNGNCQEHNWFTWGEESCINERAQRVLTETGTRP
jgi:hypothetical protein